MIEIYIDFENIDVINYLGLENVSNIEFYFNHVQRLLKCCDFDVFYPSLLNLPAACPCNQGISRVCSI